jgi:hypothetical protein
MCVPSGDELLAERVSRLLPFVALGENEAVTPLGNPDTVRFALPEKP